MNDERNNENHASPTHLRHAWRSKFLSRLQRCRNRIVSHWWVLTLALAVGLLVQAIRWHLEVPLYLSYGRMIVNLKLSIPEGSLYTEELNNFLGTQAALMQSAAVVSRAHERVGERLPAMDVQPISLKVLIQPKTTIFLVQGTGANAQYTREFVQACMEEYIRFKREMRAQTSDTTLAGLTDELVRLQTILRKSDQDLATFQSSNSVVLLEEQGTAAGNFLAGLSQRLAGLKAEDSLLRSLTLDQVLEHERRGSASDSLLNGGAGLSDIFDKAELGDSDYWRARQQILLLKAEQADWAQYLKPKHPKMVGLADEISRRERLMRIFRDQTKKQLENHRESLQVQITNLEQEVREWDRRALEVSRKSAELTRLKADSARTQALYDRLLGTMQTLDVNRQISPESVTIMEKASPAIADRPGLQHKLMLGAAFGLAGGILLLVLLDRLDDRIGSFSELQELFEEEVLGQIPREATALRKGEPGLLIASDQRYAFVEAYRNLRSSLLYMGDASCRPRTILVTSSVPNDGKSLTAANLAITLASAGAKVLLIDADLRKGSLHHRFGLAEGTPGLSEALEKEPAGECDLAKTEAQGGKGTETFSFGIPREETSIASTGPTWCESVQPTKIDNLFLLPRGNSTHRSSELFLSRTSIGLLQEGASLYDFVILDTAPVMAADDVTSLAPHVDGVLFVIRAAHSSARVARAALDLLYLRQVKVLGLVFNAVRPSNADYYYYYQYKDYHRVYPAG